MYLQWQVVLDPLLGLPFESSMRYEDFAVFARVRDVADAERLLSRLAATPLAERQARRRTLLRRRAKIAYEAGAIDEVALRLRRAEVRARDWAIFMQRQRRLISNLKVSLLKVCLLLEVQTQFC